MPNYQELYDYDIRFVFASQKVAPYSLVPLAMAVGVNILDETGDEINAGRIRRYYPGLPNPGGTCSFLESFEFANQIGQWIEKNGVLRPGLFSRNERCNQAGCDGCVSEDGLLFDQAHIITTSQDPEGHPPEHCSIPEHYGKFLLGVIGEQGELPEGYVDETFEELPVNDDCFCLVVIEGSSSGNVTIRSSLGRDFLQIGYDEISSPEFRRYQIDAYSRFKLDIPPGSTIIDAEITLTIDVPNTEVMKINIKLLDRDSMNEFSNTANHADNPHILNPNTPGRVSGISVSHLISAGLDAQDKVFLGGLRELIQSYIDRPGYNPATGGYIGIEYESDRNYNQIDDTVTNHIQRLNAFANESIQEYLTKLIRPKLRIRYALPGTVVEYDDDGKPILNSIGIEVIPDLVLNHYNGTKDCPNTNPDEPAISLDTDVFAVADDPSSAGSFKYFVYSPVPPIGSWWTQETHGNPIYYFDAPDTFPLKDCETYGIPNSPDDIGERVLSIENTSWLVEPGLTAMVGISELPARAGIVKAYIGGNGDSTPMIENVWRVYHGRTKATRHDYPGSIANAIHSSFCQNGSTSTEIILDTGASANDDFYNGHYIRIINGQGNEQYAKILDYSGASRTALIDREWQAVPDDTSEFAIIPDPRWYVEYQGFIKAWFAVDSHWLQVDSGMPWCYQDGTPGDPYQCIYHWNCWYKGIVKAKIKGDYENDSEFFDWIKNQESGFGTEFEPKNSHCHDPLAGQCLPEDSPPEGKALGDLLWPPQSNQDSDSFGGETPPCKTIHGKYSWAYLPQLGSNHPTTPIGGPVIPQLPETGLWHETKTIKKESPDGLITHTKFGWADIRFLSVLPFIQET